MAVIQFDEIRGKPNADDPTTIDYLIRYHFVDTPEEHPEIEFLAVSMDPPEDITSLTGWPLGATFT